MSELATSGGGNVGGETGDLGLIAPRVSYSVPTEAPAPDLNESPSGQEATSNDATGQSPQGQGTQAPAGDELSTLRSEVESLRSQLSGQTPVSTQQSPTDYIQLEATKIEQEATAALNDLVTQHGIDFNQARGMVDQVKQMAMQRVQLEAQRMEMLPVAREMAAQKLAKEFSLPNAEITSADLLGEGSLEGMRARAKALQETRRNQASQTRKAEKRDVVEGGVAYGAAKVDDDEGLSPTAVIARGLSRMRR